MSALGENQEMTTEAAMTSRCKEKETVWRLNIPIVSESAGAHCNHFELVSLRERIKMLRCYFSI